MSKSKKKQPTEPESADTNQTVEEQSETGQAANATTADPADTVDAAAEQAAEPATKNEAEEEALESRLLRLQADFDNYRKRTLRERTEWQRDAREEVLRDCLPVLDHYEMGLKTAATSGVAPSVQEGFQMVYDQFLNLLQSHQVKPIEAEGQPFDHNLHEAITQVPSEEHPADTVIAETRRGYLLGDKLLRPAQVVVSSGPAQEASPDTTVTVEEVAE